MDEDAVAVAICCVAANAIQQKRKESDRCGHSHGLVPNAHTVLITR